MNTLLQHDLEPGAVDPAFFAPDTDPFQDWLEANSDYCHDYMDDIREGVMHDNLAHFLSNELQKPEVLCKLFNLAATNCQHTAHGVLRDVLAAATKEAAEYDQVKAREQFAKECERAAADWREAQS